MYIRDSPVRTNAVDTLMNLRKSEALSIRMETRNNTDCLFIEAGGFQTKNGKDCKSPWFIMRRQ